MVFPFFRLIAFAVLITLFTAPLPTLAAGLTLEQAQVMAMAHSRLIEAQDFALTANRERVLAAGQLPDPVLKLGIDNLPVNGGERYSLNDDSMTMRRIGLMQELTGTDKRQSRVALAERVAEQSQAEKMARITTVRRDTALAWLDKYYAARMLAIVAEQQALSNDEILAAESAYRSGRATQADIFAARSTLALIEDRLSELQLRSRNAGIVLSRWTGGTPEPTLADLPVIDSVHLNADLESDSATATLETQLTHHPQISLLNGQVAIAEADAKLAAANKSADWTIELAYQQRGSGYGNMVTVGLTIPLQWDQQQRQNRELYAKLASVEQAKAERDEMLRQHVAEIKTLLAEWQNYRERIARFEQQLAPLARQRTLALTSAYRGGKATLADLLAARRSETDTQLQSLQLQADSARLWAQLTFLTPTDSVAARSVTRQELP